MEGDRARERGERPLNSKPRVCASCGRREPGECAGEGGVDWGERERREERGGERGEGGGGREWGEG